MRPVALVALLLLAPLASAAIELPGGPRHEQPLRPGEAHAYSIPFSTSGGEAYAKIVPTPGNAVHDGERANGTLDPPAGWRVAFALDGIGLGERVDGEPTRRVLLAADRPATLSVVVHAPSDATAPATVYVAIALAASDGGAGSGARQDEARAITLALMGGDAERETPAPSLAVLALTLALTLTLVRCRR